MQYNNTILITYVSLIQVTVFCQHNNMLSLWTVLQRDQVLLNFENKQTECINVTIMDNEVALEEMKIMTLTLHLPDGQRGTALGHLDQTRIIIVDDDGR